MSTAVDDAVEHTIIIVKVKCSIYIFKKDGNMFLNKLELQKLFDVPKVGFGRWGSGGKTGISEADFVRYNFMY